MMRSRIYGSGANIIPQLSKAEDLRTMFSTFDKDNNGFIDDSELKNTMGELGMKLSDADIKAMMTEADIKHGRIYYEGMDGHLLTIIVQISQRHATSSYMHCRCLHNVC